MKVQITIHGQPQDSNENRKHSRRFDLGDLLDQYLSSLTLSIEIIHFLSNTRYEM